MPWETFIMPALTKVSQGDPAQGRARELVQNGFQLVAGDLFQSVAHERHAEQKQGDAAEQGDDFRYFHVAMIPSWLFCSDNE